MMVTIVDIVHLSILIITPQLPLDDSLSNKYRIQSHESMVDGMGLSRLRRMTRMAKKADVWGFLSQAAKESSCGFASAGKAWVFNQTMIEKGALHGDKGGISWEYKRGYDGNISNPQASSFIVCIIMCWTYAARCVTSM